MSVTRKLAQGRGNPIESAKEGSWHSMIIWWVTSLGLSHTFCQVHWHQWHSCELDYCVSDVDIPCQRYIFRQWWCVSKTDSSRSSRFPWLAKIWLVCNPWYRSWYNSGDRLLQNRPSMPIPWGHSEWQKAAPCICELVFKMQKKRYGDGNVYCRLISQVQHYWHHSNSPVHTPTTPVWGTEFCNSGLFQGLGCLFIWYLCHKQIFR